MPSHSTHLPMKQAQIEKLRSIVGAQTVAFVGLDAISARNLTAIRSRLHHAKMRLIVGKQRSFEQTFNKTGYFTTLHPTLHKVKLGIVVSALHPYETFAILNQTEIPSFIKTGAVSLSDIIVPEGSTGTKPGPFLSELSKVGLPTTIKDGEIHIRKATTLIRAGDIVTKPQAEILQKLKITTVRDQLQVYGIGANSQIFSAILLEHAGPVMLNELAQMVGRTLQVGSKLGWISPLTISSMLRRDQRCFLQLLDHLNLLSPTGVQRGLASKIRVLHSLRGKFETG